MTQRDHDAAILYDAILDVVITARLRCPCVLRQVQDDLRERLESNEAEACYAYEEGILKDCIAYLERCIAARQHNRCAD